MFLSVITGCDNDVGDPMTCGLAGVAGWAGDTMNYSFSSQPAGTTSSLNNSESSDVNSETEENESGVKSLNTT